MLNTDVFRQYILEESLGKQDGSKAQNRFSYQVCLSLLKIIRAGEDHDDFWAIFEFHEDFCLYYFDGEGNEVWELYQVKTKNTDGNWSLAKIVQKGTNSSPSIMDKMVENRDLITTGIKKSILIGNKAYRFKFDGTRTLRDIDDITLERLNESEVQIITDKVDNINVDELSMYRCKKSSLSLCPNDRVTYLTGLLTQYIRNEFQDADFEADVIVDSLLSVIYQRSSHEDEITEVEDFVKRKGMSKEEFHSLLEKSVRIRAIGQIITETRAQLRTEQMNFPQIKQVTDALKKMNSFRMSRNDIYESISSKVNEIVQTVEGNCATLTEIFDATVEEFFQDEHESQQYQDYDIEENDIKAIVAYGYFKEER